MWGLGLETGQGAQVNSRGTLMVVHRPCGLPAEPLVTVDNTGRRSAAGGGTLTRIIGR